MSSMSEVLGVDSTTAATAERLHDDAVVIDASNVAIVNPWLDAAISEQFFDKMIAGGVTASNVTVPQDVDQGLSGAVRELRAHREWIDKASQKALLVRGVEDIETAKKEGKAGIIFGPQNATMVDGNPESVAILHQQGVRVMQLTYNHRNLLGDGCYEENDGGLSNFGRACVQEMNQQGIAVDLSHCGDQTTAQAIEASTQPVVFSHANTRAVFDHPRNKTDDHIRALAAAGGVICLLPYTPFLAAPDNGQGVPTHKDFLRHVDHVCELVGVDHVGISTDINDNNETRRIWQRRTSPELVGVPEYHRYPLGFDGDLSNFRYITMALLGAGYREDEVTQMLGGNLLRVLRQAWKS